MTPTRSSVEAAERALEQARAETVRARHNRDAAREQRNRYGGVAGHRGAYQAALERAELAVFAAVEAEQAAEATLAAARNSETTVSTTQETTR